MSEVQSTPTPDVALWNPTAAVNWSLLFTPIFGAWVQARNWTALGEGTRATRSMKWVWGGLSALPVFLFLPDEVGRGLAIAYLLTWYFISARSQVRYVRQELDGHYVRKSWRKPLVLAVTGVIGLLMVSGVLTLSLDPNLQQAAFRDDVSGVWRASHDGTLVTLRLNAEPASVDINGQSLPVTIGSYDDGNGIISFRLQGNPAAEVTIRQISDGDNRFHLLITLPDGSQDEMSFVRNL